MVMKPKLHGAWQQVRFRREKECEESNMILKLYQFAVNLLRLKMIASLNVDRRRARMAETWLFQSKELNLNWLKNTTSQNDPREWNNEQFHNMCLYHECVNDSIFILSISFPDECHLLASGAVLFRIAFIFIIMVTSLVWAASFFEPWESRREIPRMLWLM